MTAIQIVPSIDPPRTSPTVAPGLIGQVAAAFEADAARAQDEGAPEWIPDALGCCADYLRTSAKAPGLDHLLGEVGEAADGLAEDARREGMPMWLVENLEYAAGFLAEEFLRRQLRQRLPIEATGESR